MVSKQWNDLPNRFPNIALDQFIVMPNHIHGIVQLVGAPLAGARVPNAVSHNNYHYDDFRATMDNDRATADNDRATARVAPTVENIIGAYKSLCVQNCLQWIKSNNPAFQMGKLWQRNHGEWIN